MTQNQIAYWNMKETQRHNVAQEQYNTAALGETKANNLRLHERETAKNTETARHNIVSESNEALKAQASYLGSAANMVRAVTDPISNVAKIFV